jgi:hypothetical protein
MRRKMKARSCTSSALILLFPFLTASFCVGQQHASRKATATAYKCKTNHTVLRPDKPIVFLTYIGARTITEDKEKVDYLLFKITNNACQPITLLMSGEDENLGDAFVYYDLLSSTTGERLPDSKSCHVCSSNRLGVGHSITFAIAKTAVARDRDLSIDFDFTDENAFNSGTWTKHSVLFRLADLPKSANLEE